MRKILWIIILIFHFFTANSFAEDFPKNDPIPEGVMYRGINEEQWKVIKKIGDPLDCQKRLFEFQKIKNYKVINPQDCIENRNCINDALINHKYVKLKEGKYTIDSTINVIDSVLIGESNRTLIDAQYVKTAIQVDNGVVANIIVNYAKDIAFDIKFNSLLFRSIAKNTGTRNPKTKNGHGFSIVDYKLDKSRTDKEKKEGKGFSFNSCLISLESYNGYNETGNSKITKKGGNADGFQIKYGSADITLIDTHAHHNSDDGYDFWKAGRNSNNPVIRIFYSSANYNGKHPTKSNGDGNGYKFGSSDTAQKNRGKDWGPRLIYGSVACGNKMNGFDRNNSSAKIFSYNNQAKKNRKKNFFKVSKKKINKDIHVLKCSMF